MTENLFAGRFRYVEELRAWGPTSAPRATTPWSAGVPRLSGAPVRAPDIRAGAALVLAGLAADGETVVADAHHIDRGYEDLPGSWRSLGADVTRAEVPPTRIRSSLHARSRSRPAELLDAAPAGDRVALARLLSLVERGGEAARLVAGLAYLAPATPTPSA